jgi:predicted RNase H-like nuclease (RuvC/YqgF family)
MRGTSLGGILYENVRQPTEKGAHRCPKATPIRSEKNTTQSCLHMTHPREHVREMQTHLQEMEGYLRRMGKRLRRLDEQLSHLEEEDDSAVDRGKGWPTGG